MNRNVLVLTVALMLMSWTRSDAAKSGPTLSLGSVSGPADSRVDLPIHFAAGAQGVSTLQFDLLLPPGLIDPKLTAKSMAKDAGKDIQSSPIKGGLRVLIFGLNQKTLESGSVAFLRLQIAHHQPPGDLTVSLRDIAAADRNAKNVAVNGTSGSVQVTASPARLKT